MNNGIVRKIIELLNLYSYSKIKTIDIIPIFIVISMI